MPLQRWGNIGSTSSQFPTVLQQGNAEKDEIVGDVLQESNFLTQDSQKIAIRRQISRLIGKETQFYNLNVKTAKGDFLLLDIGTEPFIKDGKKIGEISIVERISNADSVEDITVMKQSNEPEDNQLKSSCLRWAKIASENLPNFVHRMVISFPQDFPQSAFEVSFDFLDTLAD